MRARQTSPRDDSVARNTEW